MARGLKFRIMEVEGVSYLHVCRENKGADQLVYGFVLHLQKAGFLMTWLVFHQIPVWKIQMRACLFTTFEKFGLFSAEQF